MPPALPGLGNEELQESPARLGKSGKSLGRVREGPGSTAGEAAPFDVLYCHHLRTCHAQPRWAASPWHRGNRGAAIRRQRRGKHSPGRALGAVKPELWVQTPSLTAIPTHRDRCCAHCGSEGIPNQSQFNRQGSPHTALAELQAVGARALAVLAAVTENPEQLFLRAGAAAEHVAGCENRNAPQK